MYTKIKKCRLCGSSIKMIIDLGNQVLTGFFPKPGEIIPSSPLELVMCVNPKCNLVQLRHTYSLKEMYGMNYGYRSGLNNSMRWHLEDLYENKCKPYLNYKEEDIGVDIGANDGTLLRCFDSSLRIAIDPTITKFKDHYCYNQDFILIEDFFPTKKLNVVLQGRKAKVITSIACFYDLENPLEFAQAISDILNKEGVWITEQSYMPAMIRQLAYDTICHEHLEYYGLKQIKYIADKTGLKIIDVTFNDTNGGSFCVTLTKKESLLKENKDTIENILFFENNLNLSNVMETFHNRIELHKMKLKDTLEELKAQGKTIYGYGASTKGNVLLQYCGLNSDHLKNIVEINEDKFDCVTPGSCIPIISEKKIQEKVDYYMVLPWHFKENILNREKDKNFIFPLPEIQIINKGVNL
jgi:hypothetical protein